VRGEVPGVKDPGMPPEPEGYAADDGKRAQGNQAVASLSSPLSSQRGALREDQNGPDYYSPLLAACPAHIPSGACLKPILCGTRLSACHGAMEAARPRRARNLSAISFHPKGFKRCSGPLPVPHQGYSGMPCRASGKQRTARQYLLHHLPPGSEQTRSFPPHPLPAQYSRVGHDAGRAAYAPPYPL
jgi:hypothetical protein